jgi:hypothetical protein
MGLANDRVNGYLGAIKAPVSMRLGDLESSVLRRKPDGRALGGVLRRDLARYYRVLGDSLRRVKLSPEEAHCVVMALWGHDLDAGSYRFLWAEVEQRIREGHKEFVPDGCDIRALPHGALMAIVDAADQYWARVGEGSVAEPKPSKDVNARLLYEVGLTRAFVDA